MRITCLLILASSVLASACAKGPLLGSARTGEEALQTCRGLRDKKNYDEAIQCFELLKGRFGGSLAAVDADLEVADTHYRKGEYLVAAEGYRSFTQLRPIHDKIGYANYRTGLSYLKEGPKGLGRDTQRLEEAVEYLQRAYETAPAELRDVIIEKLKEARTRVARKHFYVGRFYHRTKEYLAAIPRFQEVLAHYSGLGLDEKALFLMGDSFFNLSQKEKSLEILSVFEQHFPNSPFRKRLASKVGIK